MFRQDVYHASIAEHSAAGTEVARVEATDADAGMYGEVSYTVPGEWTWPRNMGAWAEARPGVFGVQFFMGGYVVNQLIRTVR